MDQGRQLLFGGLLESDRANANIIDEPHDVSSIMFVWLSNFRDVHHVMPVCTSISSEWLHRNQGKVVVKEHWHQGATTEYAAYTWPVLLINH
jgi:hypothetical protein